MYHKECEKVIKKYPNYDSFKENAFIIKQGQFFDETESKKVNNIILAEQQLELAEQKGYQLISI